MKKLKLEVETLAVEAFVTSTDGKAALRGTMRANAETEGCPVFTTGTLFETRHADCTLPPTLACPIDTRADECL